MNIKKLKNRNIDDKLFESETTPQSNEYAISDKYLEFIENPQKTIIFDCGIKMTRIQYSIEYNFGLHWHAENTNSEEEFIESVGKYLSLTGNELTSSDINKLKSEYKKYK